MVLLNLKLGSPNELRVEAARLWIANDDSETLLLAPMPTTFSMIALAEICPANENLVASLGALKGKYRVRLGTIAICPSPVPA
jgi:hypothetical protein